MKLMPLKITLTLFILLSHTSRVEAAVSLLISPGADGTAALTITATGFINATNDSFLLFGTNEDSFLPNGAPQRYSGTVLSAPIPLLSLGGSAAINNFYRDDQSGFTGLESILAFYFPGTLNGLLDLSDLDGVYYLPESRFSDFVIGTHYGLRAGTRPNHLQGLGEVTIRVVPEPISPFLAGVGALFGLARRSRKIPSEQDASGNRR